MPETAAVPRSTARNAGAAQPCEVRDLGRAGYRATWDLQLELVRARKAGSVCDQLVFVEHPPTITLGRNADAAHILEAPGRLRRLGIQIEETDRGGDVTYHGPGQVVAYPILDLSQWRRDVGAYLRALEEVIIVTLQEFGVYSQRIEGLTGVWVEGAKIAALGVHLSRWVTSHGLALNVETNLAHFGLIVPCGLQKPVTSMREVLGHSPGRGAVLAAMRHHFGSVFRRAMIPAGSTN